jgi:hypothetical protein
MRYEAEDILRELREVSFQRSLRKRDAALSERVDALKRYQQARFQITYADLLASARHGPAARFFLNELYGPGDFSLRDAQFARIVPTLVRLFPQGIVETVVQLARVHALSERLDTRMAQALHSPQIDPVAYVQAWQACGEPDQRRLQLTLTLAVGRSLDGYARKPMLRASLHMMRGPAKAAGLGDLQHFLESGFDTFQAMRGAQAFLGCIEARETELMERLFAPDAVAKATDPCRANDRALVQLPLA